MCTGSKKQSVEPAPVPDPAPPPPTMTTPVATQADQKKQMEKFRYGLASTIKTGPRGLSGQGADLSGNSQLKSKLGA